MALCLFKIGFFLQLLTFQVAYCLDSAYFDNIASCLESDHHKVSPGVESDLYKQCGPWKNYSCCTTDVAEKLHHSDGFAALYTFNLNHCQEKQKLSDECHRHFTQDACFYQCEPNLGPWKVKVKRKFATERFFRVPLCLSDCESWYNACKHDYTCVTNWPRNMNFSGGKGNKCPTGAECRTFEEMYNNNASYFCNEVWDESFVTVPDNELCMRIWFDGSQGNPNEHMAKEFVRQYKEQHSSTGNYVATVSLCSVIISAFISAIASF